MTEKTLEQQNEIIRDAARAARPGDDNIEIDDDSDVIRSDHGYWVHAWVYVSDEKLPDL